MAVGVTDHEKCIKQFVLTAVENVKFHSNLQKDGQFIAENATRKSEEGISFF